MRHHGFSYGFICERGGRGGEESMEGDLSRYVRGLEGR